MNRQEINIKPAIGETQIDIFDKHTNILKKSSKVEFYSFIVIVVLCFFRPPSHG